MRNKTLGRRRFLRATAVGAVGIAGGVAATGTAAAKTPGTVVVRGSDNEWHYTISMKEPSGGENASKKGSADSEDETHGQIASGNVKPGDKDAYSFTDQIDIIRADQENGPGFLHLEKTMFEEVGQVVAITGSDDQFNYTLKSSGNLTKRQKADSNDKEIGGNKISGKIGDESSDNYTLAGHITHFSVDCGYGSMTVDFN